MGFGQCLHLMMAIGHSENPPSGFGEVITGFKGKRKGGGEFHPGCFLSPLLRYPCSLAVVYRASLRCSLPAALVFWTILTFFLILLLDFMTFFFSFFFPFFSR